MAYNNIITRVPPYVFLNISGGCYNERLAISRDGARCLDSTQELPGAGMYLFYFSFLFLARMVLDVRIPLKSPQLTRM